MFGGELSKGSLRQVAGSPFRPVSLSPVMVKEGPEKVFQEVLLRRPPEPWGEMRSWQRERESVKFPGPMGSVPAMSWAVKAP